MASESELPPGWCEPYDEGLSPTALGERLGRSTIAVKNRLTRLRRQGKSERLGAPASEKGGASDGG